MTPDAPLRRDVRLLGDLLNGDPVRIEFGVNAYREAGGPVAIDPRLVTALDRAGLVCAVIHWFHRASQLPPGDSAITQRIRRLVTRLSAI